MTKAELMSMIDCLDDEDEVDIRQLEREAAEAREQMIEDLEERQHMNGFYTFQDKMWNWRNER